MKKITFSNSSRHKEPESIKFLLNSEKSSSFKANLEMRAQCKKETRERGSNGNSV